MKYIQTVQTFYERLEMIPLSVGAIALWHALMHMNHKQNGSKEFKAASRALCFKSGLPENMLEESRQELLQKGFIRYEEIDDGLAATYVLCPLGAESERNGEHIEDHVHETESGKSNYDESERRAKKIDHHIPKIDANETDHPAPEIRTEQINHSEPALSAERVDHNESEGVQKALNHSEPRADQEANDDHTSSTRTSPVKNNESETVQGTFVTHHEHGIGAGPFGEQESDLDESTQKAALDTNTGCRLQAQIKKLEMHEKLLQKGWQQSVNISLTDVEMKGELLSALQQYQSGDLVSIVIQPGPIGQGVQKAEDRFDHSAQHPTPAQYKQDKSSIRLVEEQSKQNQSSHTKQSRQGHPDQNRPNHPDRIQTDQRLTEESRHPYTQIQNQPQQKKTGHDAVTEQPLAKTRAVQLSKKTKTSPRTKTRAKGKKRQPKRGAESLNAGPEEEIISMGPFEDSPTDNTGKEKIIQEIVF